MRLKLSSRFAFLPVLFCLVAFAHVTAQAKDMKFRTFLVWATDDETSPNSNHKPVSKEVQKKLSELPLKWKNYFEVKREDNIGVGKGEKKQVKLSDQCSISLKNIDDNNIEVKLFGKGEQVLTRTQPIADQEILVLGGNAPGSTGWLVVVKRID